MKKGLIFPALFIFFMSLALTSAACDLNITLLNQDPYPAVPGDSVKLVFQLDGVDSPTCSDITFELLENYPIKLNPGETGLKIFKKVDYVKDYETSILIPYEVRINPDTLDGATPIEIRAKSKGDALATRTFNIETEDVRANFEIYVKDYNYATNKLTLEVLNIAKANVEALTLDIPKQNSIAIKGGNRMVVGDLDSNEYTTADFEAVPSDGEFKINLTYSDTINKRRTIEKTISFDSSYFLNRKADEKTTGMSTYVLGTIIVLLVVWWALKKFKKKK